MPVLPRLILVFMISVLVFSCQKEPDVDLTDTPPPPPTTIEFSKLKSIVYNEGFYQDSTCYRYDTANNKIRMIRYYPLIPGDSVTFIYSYNDKNQLVSYEYLVDNNSIFAQAFFADVIKMEFVRNTSGQLEKVLSTYRESRVQQSEGIVRHTKNGDTTFITYVDSVQKNFDPTYYDFVDHYKVAIKNDRVLSIDFMAVASHPYYEERDEFVYNASGALNSLKVIQPGAQAVTTFQRGTVAATELQKFKARLAGDLYWFFRTKNFNFDYIVGASYFLAGPCPTRISGDGYVNTFVNEYNSAGQLVKVTSSDGSASGNIVETITYYP